MDRLSKLPNEVICHILSFLTTKEAASTSVLSTRWRNLLAFVPNLNLHDYIILHHEEGKRERKEVLQIFMDFVDRVLAMQGDSTLKKFSLKCRTGVDSDRVDHWICNALRRGVSELTLSIPFEDGYRLPPETFVSRTLVRLKVRHGLDRDLHVLGVSLPMLKSLLFRFGKLRSDQFEMLIRACPALETLDMHTTEWLDTNVTVSSSSLKTLSLHSYGCTSALTQHPKSISFDTPSLVSFVYSDFVAEDYPIANLTNVVVAEIDLLFTDELMDRARAPNIDGEDDVYLKRFCNVGKLFIGIKHVRQLYLFCDTIEVLDLCSASIPVFNNLRVLGIRSEIDRGWQGMPYLLMNCPHLEYLTFDGILHCKTDKCGDACDCISREDKGRSLRSCPVKKLQIKEFRGTNRELEMIEHFLKSFTCLTETDIYARDNGPTELKVRKDFERANERIKLYDELYTSHVNFLMAHSLIKCLQNRVPNS